MKVFESYSQYYDLLYKDKDYLLETNYVDKLLKRFCPSAKTILELGCGTGKHAILLSEKGYKVDGIDLSQTMLEIAFRRYEELPEKIKQKLSFFQGDVRTVRNYKKYDAVISLFHVASYQTTNEDLVNYFNTAKEHLNPGGIFIFDCWYGPAVLTDRPVVRVKRLENELIKVTRIAEPVINENENIVDVNYQITIQDKKSCKIEEIFETHRMRYLFMPEIKKMFLDNNLELINSEEWLTEKEIDFMTWNACFIGEKK